MLRLHVSADDLTKDYLSPNRALNSMASVATQELPLEELDGRSLIGVLQELQNNSIRRPDHFNNLHFLLFLLYDSYGQTRDRYPLWRWYHRMKKKLIINKHLTIDNEKSRQAIQNSVEDLINSTSNITELTEERVKLEPQYLNSHIHGLFNMYSCLHTYIYMEQVDLPIVNNIKVIFDLFQPSIIQSYPYENNDLIHFAIVHKKVNLLDRIFEGHANWLDRSIGLTTARGWSPLHYASYVGDKEIVKVICEKLTILISSSHRDSLSFLIPFHRQAEFGENPNEYILKACGVERDARRTKPRKHSMPLLNTSISMGSNDIRLQQQSRSNPKRQVNEDQSQKEANQNVHVHTNNINSQNMTNDSDIPDADELELSSFPLIQREEFIDKIIHGYDPKHMFIPSPLILACMATCGERSDYEEIVQILLESHLVEFDGLNHDCVLNHILDYMSDKRYAHFQRLRIYRDTETDGPSAFLYYVCDGFIVNQIAKPLSQTVSGSSATLNTSRNESMVSDDDNQIEASAGIRCFLTVLVIRDIFLQYPHWDVHLLRENIEEYIDKLEETLGYRPTILYPDGEVISYQKHSDITWEVKVKYRLSSETGHSLFMEVDYYFFESYGDPFADAIATIYQTPFYVSCMSDSTVMIQTIFDSFFKRRNHFWWGTIAQKHLEHCFDGILQIKNNGSTFLSLCTALSRYYQVDGDPFKEENSALIQRIFVHAFACCVRRNAKIELDYLIKNHALIYYDSCRAKPSDIRHNILTYCVVRNLAVVFDQLMTSMKTTMYKTHQNSTNPEWQPHIAWREIIHVIIDPVSQLQIGNHEQYDFSQLACYGDTIANASSIVNVPILHASGEEYVRCKNARKSIVTKIKRTLQQTSSEGYKPHPLTTRVFSLDQRQIERALDRVGDTPSNIGDDNNLAANTANGTSIVKRSRNILKNVTQLSRKISLKNSLSPRFNPQQHELESCSMSPTIMSHLDHATTSKDTVSLPDVHEDVWKDNRDNEDGNCSIIDDDRTTTKMLNRSLMKNKRLKYNQTVGAVESRTPLQHLQAIFWPSKESHSTMNNRKQQNEQDEVLTAVLKKNNG